MVKQIKKLFSWSAILILFVIFLCGPSFALASSSLNLHYPTIFGLSINSTSTLPEYARYFFNTIMVLTIIVSVIVVAIGGVYYLASFARGKFTDEGKSWIKSGLLGLLISLSAYTIAY